MPQDSDFLRIFLNPETTRLSPNEEYEFQKWVKNNNITDVDYPDSFYDLRGYWKEMQGAPQFPGLMTSRNTWGPREHFIDKYKQHGHPTFSVESKYSVGPSKGGMWLSDYYFPEMRPWKSNK